jgi:hypothetical protein
VYRNGVAYFERHARVSGNQLKLEVPGQRLDDFLKSLTVVDTKTGKLVPISFPTLDDQAEEVTIALALPKDKIHDLKITYVTESPSWKPSYRLELRGKKPARLEAWAVVHNVSGEDWKNVAIGVGSTSALSFRYDLRSVHFVDRATLTDETVLGVAPPSGGSPYTVASNEVQVLGAVKQAGNGSRSARGYGYSAEGAAMGAGAPGRPRTAAQAHKGEMGPAEPEEASSEDGGLAQVAERARATKQKIRIEGYARAGDKDRRQASLANANAVRDGLVRNGVPLDQIDVVATGSVSNDVARVVAVGDSKPQPVQAPSAGTDEPLGDAYFLTQRPLDVEKNHSAMVRV